MNEKQVISARINEEQNKAGRLHAKAKRKGNWLGVAYNDGVIDGLRLALDIIRNHASLIDLAATLTDDEATRAAGLQAEDEEGE